MDSNETTASGRGLIVVGCTGGIGSGKSSVTALFAGWGATILDADEEARRALVPGSPGHDAVVAHFGDRYLASDGTIDRPRLGELVFGDPLARAELEAIVHPVVQQAFSTRLDQLRVSGGVAVLDIPLLVETGGRARYGLDGVLVVDAPEALAVERLVRHRHLAPEVARARVAAQASRDERLRAADYIILNIGSLDELQAMAAAAWRWIVGLGEESEIA